MPSPLLPSRAPEEILFDDGGRLDRIASRRTDA